MLYKYVIRIRYIYTYVLKIYVFYMLYIIYMVYIIYMLYYKEVILN